MSLPRHVDEYQQLLEAYERQATPKGRLSPIPVWAHPFRPSAEAGKLRSSFSMLLTAGGIFQCRERRDVCGASLPATAPAIKPPRSHPKLDALVRYAIHLFFRDFVLSPHKQFREPGEGERRPRFSILRDALLAACSRRDPLSNNSGKFVY